VILLHGFPDFWRGWRRQIPALAEAGLRVVAPDMRGYHRSDRPPTLSAYAMRRLVADVLGLIDALGADRVHLAGHDWGGVIAWYLAMSHPQRVDRLVIANAPHPAAFRRELKRGGQLLRSWYAGFFQLPLIPEWILGRDHCAAIGRIFRRSPERPGAFSEADIAAYRDAAADPGALRAMIAYYRAALRHPAPRQGTVGAPTLLIWGEKDRALSPRLTVGLERWVPELSVLRIAEAGHWVMADAPDQVNAAMVGFLA
jgi:epoxide hydrolase 4